MVSWGASVIQCMNAIEQSGRDIELIDLVPVMSNLDHPRTLFAHTSNPFINGHLNREGYRLIGEQISDRLVNNR